MKYQKVKLIALLLLLLSNTGLYAQNSLNIKEKSGTQTTFIFESIRKLTFAPGNITVNKNDGNSSTYTLNSIRNLNFADQITDIDQANRMKSSRIILCPNPVNDLLQLNFESINSEILHVKIINIQGRVFHQQTISCQKGTNNVIIPVTHLSGGLYICYLQIDNKIESVKFLKKEN